MNKPADTVPSAEQPDQDDAIQDWLSGTWPTDADGAPHVEASHIRAVLAPRTLRERVAARIENAGVRIGALLVDVAEAVRGGR